MVETAVTGNGEVSDDLELLRERLAELCTEREKLERKNSSLAAENAWLQQRVRDLIARLYGRRHSEKLPPGQEVLPLFDMPDAAARMIKEAAASLASTAPTPQRRPGKHGRKRLPENLPRVREEILPEPEARLCKCCGKEMDRIGEEVTEELDYRPASFLVREIARVKFACRDCQEGVVTPPLPPRPIEKGRPGEGLLAHIAVSKHADHLPLHRQEVIFARMGLDLRRSTLCDWMGSLSNLLLPILMEMKRFVLSQIFVQSDDTHVQVRDADVKGATRRGFLWVYCLPWAEVVYDFTLSRAQEMPRDFLGDFKGYLQTDAYGGYNAVFRNGTVIHVGCMAHARRKFHEAQKEAPEETAAVLSTIQALYRIEAEAKEAGLDRQARVELRRERATPLLAQLKRLLDTFRPKALPQSKLGMAIQYALLQWESLTRYVDIGEAEIDNNSAENALRGVVVGRHNWLFLGSPEGGGLRATVLYSLIQSCKRLKIEPFAYLKDVIPRVSIHPASRVWELTPRGWKEAREKEQASAQQHGQPP